jgi:hypothetical protein
VIDFAPVFEGLGAIGALLAWLGAALILYAYRSTLGALLSLLVKAIQSVSVPTPFGGIDVGKWIAAPISALDNAVLQALGTAVEAAQYSYHRWMHELSSTFDWIGQAVDYDMHEVGKALGALRRGTIPRLIHEAISAAEHPIQAAIGALTGDIAVARHTIDADVKAAERDAQALERATAARIGHVENVAKGAAAAAIAVTLPGIHGLERDWDAVKARLDSISKKLSLAGIAGLVALGLSELGLGSQRCSNNKKLTKSVCGLSTKVLDDLLAGLVAIVGTVSLIELAEDYQKLFINVSGEAVKFWRADVAGPPINPTLGDTGFHGTYTPPAGVAQGNPSLGSAGLLA